MPQGLSPQNLYWRISYIPRRATVLREPYQSDTRKLNLKGSNSKYGLSVQHEGEVSRNACAKIRNAVLWLEASAKWKWCYSKQSDKWFRWKLNFIHLTVPYQGTKSDKFVKKILNRFFLYAYRKTGMKSYIWKAEPQQRGDIHFHITSDCFIWKKTLQNIWNGCLRYYGLIGTHADPPSTRVHPTHNIVNMANYLIKYMTKNDKDKRIIEGRLWGCSRNLSQAKTFHVTVNDNQINAERYELKKQSYRVDYYDWLSVYNLKPTYFYNMNECEVLEKYREQIKKIREGYAENQNLFFDENGNIMSYIQAVKKGLNPLDQLLYAEEKIHPRIIQ